MALVRSFPFTAKPFRAFPNNPKTPSFLSQSTLPLLIRRSSSLTTSDVLFTWDDAVRISQPDSLPDEPSNLRGYSDKVKLCNRGLESQSEFRSFVIEDQIVGYIHNGFAENLRSYRDVFTFLPGQVTLHSSLRTAEDRTRAVGDVIKSLGEELIPGIRNELYPVTAAFGAPAYFSLERAAAPYFGIKPHGVACGDNVVKECEEEAGIPSSISRGAVPVGAVSYMDIDGYRYKRDVLFCYDLKLPESFMPENQDGEVESFKLIPVEHVANIIQRTQFFKPNCSLVIIDFLFRHGYISPECFGYLDLLQSLRSGSCS
ncbi:nudix hydrolase 20, chloroplastic-like isoform X2 [Argentina anserina]|uniref:nudix hydrolase 20, chloroplastic-like isoform X2 n=1 Tax=Argentina anserina TaxID=57926 RepID=UPI0021762FBF|nr:nudix hydrolase 20, chloroplastic-like isoform X2 [Potentilla anserina]